MIKIQARPVSIAPSAVPGASVAIRQNNQLSYPTSNQQFRTADQYQKTDQRTHVYTRPDSYCGSDQPQNRNVRIVELKPDNVGYLIKNVIITMPEAIENIFNEIIANSADSVEESRQSGVNPMGINITMTDTTISIWNGGMPIPVVIHPTYKQYVPQIIFGELLTSSNYNDKKSQTVRGRNGYGAKITNIFSKYFEVEIGDPNNGKHYRQIWRNNMLVREEPIINVYHGESFVKVTYVLDFERFNLQKYPAEAFYLFARYALDAALTTKERVVFNGIDFNTPLIEDYAKHLSYKDENGDLMKTGKLPKHIISYTWPDGVETYTKGNTKYARDPKAMPFVEVIVLDTPDDGKMISFVNGADVYDGGVHVDKVLHAICDPIIKELNEKFVNTTNEGKDKNKLKALNIGNVRSHITIIISCRVVNPKWSNQVKTKLAGPQITFKIDEKILRQVNTWKLADALYNELKRKQFEIMNKGKSKRGRRKILSDKATPANFAGTKRSHECVAFIVEGDSASSFPVKLIKYLGNDAPNFYGIFILGGKPLNARQANIFKIAKNKVISELTDFLGLQEGIDYRIAENRKHLNYGRVVILTDADADGAHIGGLAISNFECRFQTLLQTPNNPQVNQLGQLMENNYLYFLRTRFVVLNNGMAFYTEEDYNAWLEEDPSRINIKGRYLKGLGSNTNKDIKFESQNLKMVLLNYDDYAHNSLDLAFQNGKAPDGRKYTDLRKEWITKRQVYEGLSKYNRMPISVYVNTEVIKHSVDNVLRTIPNMMDGLKPSQRKALYGAFKKFNWRTSAGDDNTIKVASLASYVIDTTNYHHGEASLQQAIIFMAQLIPGKDNIDFFFRGGQFGTRLKMGKDSASPRYIFTKLARIALALFSIKDKPILKLKNIEGQICEPDYLAPIIPPIYNQIVGIGTGWSSTNPAYDPLELALAMICKINGQAYPELMPFYYKFKGDLIVRPPENKLKKKKSVLTAINSEAVDNDSDMEADDIEVDIEDTQDDAEKLGIIDNDETDDIKDNIMIDENTKLVLESRGKYHTDEKGNVHITELPLGMSTKKYETFLKTLLEDGKISDINQFNNDEDVHFIIHGLKSVTHKSLRLIKQQGMSNFWLLNKDNVPQKFDTIYEYLDLWYQYRLAIYQERKDFNIKDLNDKLNDLNYKIMYIELVLQKVIPAAGISKIDLKVELEKRHIPYDKIKDTKTRNMTIEGLAKLRKEAGDVNEKLQKVRNTKITDTWLEDIYNFINVYTKHYQREMPAYRPHSEQINGFLMRKGQGPVEIVVPNTSNIIRSNGLSFTMPDAEGKVNGRQVISAKTLIKMNTPINQGAPVSIQVIQK